MDKTNIRKETREVSEFERVSIRGLTYSAQVYITQGEREGLSIEAPPEILRRLRSEVKDGKLTIRLEGSWLEELQDALSNWMNKPYIRYYLHVRELTALEVQCAYIIYVPRLETSHLSVKLSGCGDFRLDWLQAERLEVHHSGSGVVQICGLVEEQRVVLNGAGSYIAPGLESQRADVRLRGVGMARVHANQMLETEVRGVGSLEYSGNAQVRTRISGPGQIVYIAKAKGEAVGS